MKNFGMAIGLSFQSTELHMQTQVWVDLHKQILLLEKLSYKRVYIHNDV